MNLFFLNPWFLLGALAAAVPLWLHLRRKPETNLWPFSTLRFLEDNPRPRSGAWQLRDLLLFMLRVLAVLLVVGAFAWPYLRGEELLVVKESRVYILDNTLSHQAGGGFIRDRDRIAEELARADPSLQIAVLELTAQPRVVAAFGDPREEAVSAVKDLAPSFQRGSYLAAFRQAGALFANSLGQRKRIILCGDNQENQWAEDAQVPPFLRQIEIEIPPGGAEQAPNLAVAEPRLQRIYLGDNSLVNCTFKLVHLGGATRADVTLQANNQTILSRTVSLEEAPQTVLLQAQWEADPALWLRGQVRVEGEPDALEGDNRAFFSLAPVREGTVALLALSPYLRLGLSPEVMRGHWSTRWIDPTRLAEEISMAQDAEVLVIESGYLQSAPARQLVLRYLANGHGVLLLVNRLTPAVSAVLRELGFAAHDAVPAAGSSREALGYFLSGHPIFHPFLSPDYGNLLEVGVRLPHRLEAKEGVPLLFSSSGTPVFFQGTGFPGRLFVAGFGFDREQTSWPTHLTFIPFLDLCLQGCRPEDSTPNDYEPGAVSLFQFPNDTTVSEVVLRDGSREIRRAPVMQGKASLVLPDQPGLFSVCLDDATEPEKTLNVNPSPKESQLRYLQNPPALELWRGELQPEVSARVPPAGLAQTSLAAILQQRIWWWLLLAGCAVLLLETVWTLWRKERI